MDWVHSIELRTMPAPGLICSVKEEPFHNCLLNFDPASQIQIFLFLLIRQLFLRITPPREMLMWKSYVVVVWKDKTHIRKVAKQATPSLRAQHHRSTPEELITIVWRFLFYSLFFPLSLSGNHHLTRRDVNVQNFCVWWWWLCIWLVSALTTMGLQLKSLWNTFRSFL